MFLAAFGFFAAVVFLPRWFQVVGGASATVSGYQMLPLLGGLIFSAVASGQIVARTGRYRLLLFGALVTTAAGLAMLTQLRADTPLPLAVGVDVRDRHRRRADVRGVPADRPEQRPGPADRRRRRQQPVVLPAGRRDGRPRDHGHGLRVVADARGARRRWVRRGAARGRCGALAGSGGAGVAAITGVGDMGAAILASLPADARALVEPFIPAIVDGDPPGVLDRDGVDVRDRDRDLPRGRGPRARVPRVAGHGRGDSPGTPRPGADPGRAPRLIPRSVPSHSPVPGVPRGVRRLRVYVRCGLPATGMGRFCRVGQMCRRAASTTIRTTAIVNAESATMLTIGTRQAVEAIGRGRFGVLRSIKRGISGEAQRDVDTIAAPFSLVADPNRGSIADLRRAVVARQLLESELGPDYVRDLVADIGKGGHGAIFVNISDMATKAVLSGSFEELADAAVRISSRHWLLRELDSAA